MSTRAWLSAVALALAFWVVFLGSLFAVHALGHVHSCHTRKCDRRVHRARAIRWRWRWIKAHPMPTCTYVGESSAPGDYSDPYGERRYRARNLSSTAGGKYQLLDTSAHAVGIPNYPGTHDAADAPPLLQERAARRLLAIQGIHAWSRC